MLCRKDAMSDCVSKEFQVEIAIVIGIPSRFKGEGVHSLIKS